MNTFQVTLNDVDNALKQYEAARKIMLELNWSGCYYDLMKGPSRPDVSRDAPRKAAMQSVNSAQMKAMNTRADQTKMELPSRPKMNITDIDRLEAQSDGRSSSMSMNLGRLEGRTINPNTSTMDRPRSNQFWSPEVFQQ